MWLETDQCLKILDHKLGHISFETKVLMYDVCVFQSDLISIKKIPTVHCTVYTSKPLSYFIHITLKVKGRPWTIPPQNRQFLPPPTCCLFKRSHSVSERFYISIFLCVRPQTSISVLTKSTIVSIHIRLVTKFGHQNSDQNPWNPIWEFCGQLLLEYNSDQNP